MPIWHEKPISLFAFEAIGFVCQININAVLSGGTLRRACPWLFKKPLIIVLGVSLAVW